jgi:hypothetical protein
VTPSETLVSAVAAKYDNDEGDLQRSTVRRLAYRLARSGKACASCEVVKPVAGFGVDNRKPDGLDSRCKACEAARSRAARAARNAAAA